MKKRLHLRSIAKSIVAFSLATTLFLSAGFSSHAAVLGIDVSKWNGGINWGSVAASGVSYTFIKVGSTKSGIDPAFAANVRSAQACGIKTGVYIYSYATSVEAAVNEANLVLQWIEGYNINFPVAFDIEDKTQRGLDPNTVTAMCNAFCDVIASAGYYPIVYTYTNFYKGHMTGDLRYDKWIAQYGSSCNIPGYSIWQASQTGSIPGVPGNVDINYMVKDYNAIIIPFGFIQRGDFVYFYNNYRMQFGWVDVNGLRYHMDAAGHMNTGWFQDESGLYYLAADGHALVGPNQIGNDFFYFTETGNNVGGWITIGEQKFYYDPLNGNRMLKGWFQDETGRHYLFPADGHMVTGPITIDKKNYLFNAEGAMLTGWQELAGQKFFYNPADGSMYTGWLGDISNRYYFSPVNGAMLTGVQNIDGNIYYLNEKTGQVLTGWQTIGGTNYYFDPMTGAMYKGLIPGVDGTYYTSEVDGHQAINEAVMIGKNAYVFGADGKMVINQLVQIGDMLYLTDATGVVTATAPANPAPVPAQ